MPKKQQCESMATSFLAMKKSFMPTRKRKHRRSLAASFCNEVLHAPPQKKGKKKRNVNPWLLLSTMKCFLPTKPETRIHAHPFNCKRFRV
jgi:hypothetical protein